MNAHLKAAWRARADRLDAYARELRTIGDTIEAQDAEQAATDYRIAADELEVTDEQGA